MNYLMIESLQKYHHYYGDRLRVEFGSCGGEVDLEQAADELAQRLVNIFVKGENGRRAFNGGVDLFQTDPHWRDHLLFYEHFHGDNGAGIGACHQTAWTGLVAKLIQQTGGK